MKGFRNAVFRLCVVLAFLADAATARTNAPAQSSRRYDSRVHMHTSPIVGLQVPDDDPEPQKGAPEPSERDLLFQNSTPQESQIRPNGPRLKATPDKPQSKNWILPSLTEMGQQDEETTLDQREEPVPSGWGWLADDVRARQQKQEGKDTREESESSERDNGLQGPSAFQQEDVELNTDGIFLDTAFKPVSSSIPTKENKTAGAEVTSARDESQEEQKSQAAGPITPESPRNRTAADHPREQKFGADATWGNERLWNKRERAVSALPQTEALLSTSKPDAQKPFAEMDRPGFNPDIGGNAINRFEARMPEPTRRDLATAARFQPLPAPPVNDLGSTPWDEGTPGRTPFADSTPFSPESGIAPSRPIESLNAADLPKPVATPWLK